MEQMTWADLEEVDSEILKKPTWNNASEIERVIIISLIKELVVQDDTLNKPWKELEVQQRGILLSRGILGD